MEPVTPVIENDNEPEPETMPEPLRIPGERLPQGDLRIPGEVVNL